MGFNAEGEPILDVFPSDPAAFRAFTSQHLGRRVGIFLDGKLLTAPTLRGPIYDQAEIVGRYTPSELKFIAALINSGPLPAKIELASPLR